MVVTFFILHAPAVPWQPLIQQPVSLVLVDPGIIVTTLLVPCTLVVPLPFLRIPWAAQEDNNVRREGDRIR